MKQILMYCILASIMLVQPVSGISGDMSLLAVSESQEGYKGAIADLNLDIRPGTGNVFFDTFPLTTIDTQISTRFAKEIACNFLEIDCSNYDFIYTITSDSSIIGGPSAGAAIAVLTASLLSEVPYDKDIAITGTINSGSTIGPVGGLKAKIKAASEHDLRKVLIPVGTREFMEDNETIDLYEYGKNLSIEVKEVSTLDEALFEFTGVIHKEYDDTLYVDDNYIETMKFLAETLCNRSQYLKRKLQDISLDADENMSRAIAENLTMQGLSEYENSKYYSAASYCFGANVRYNYALLIHKNRSQSDMDEKIADLHEKILNFSQYIDTEEIETLTDLESFMIVKDRLREAENFLDDAESYKNITKDAWFDIGYAEERLYSAYAWFTFFDNRGRKYIINEDLVKNSCQSKISEAEERYHYFSYHFPQLLPDAKIELDYAYENVKKNDYELCLFRASKSKATTDTVLSLFGVTEENVEQVVEQKIQAAKRNIIRQIDNNVFPVLGYSYYEYARSLKDSDVYSSLLYAEYALELSSLDLYFKEREQKMVDIEIPYDYLIILGIGICIGFLTATVLYGYKKKHS